jgi:cytochrome c oxidase subunit 2
MSTIGPVSRWHVLTVGVIAALPAVAACGADGAGGEAVYRGSGCSACHGGDRSGTALGPALRWQAGDEVELADGSTVIVDESYVERSIVEPSAQLTAGWSDTMPTVDLAAGDVDALVAFLLGDDAR